MAEKSELTKLTGMWLNESKNGQKYFSGKANQKTLGDLSVMLANNPGKDLRLLVFKNNKQEKDTDPGYNLFYQIEDPKEKPAQAAPKDDTLPF